MHGKRWLESGGWGERERRVQIQAFENLNKPQILFRKEPDNFGIEVLVNGANGEGARRGRKGSGALRGESLGNMEFAWLS